MSVNKDWTGNNRTAFAILAASNHTDCIREEHDYYATDPSAVECLMRRETFAINVWECAVGGDT